MSHPINTAQDFVLAPLRPLTNQPTLQLAVSTYEAPPAKTQTGSWPTAAYSPTAPNNSTCSARNGE